MGPGPFLKGPTCCSTFSRRSMSSDFDCCSLCSTLTHSDIVLHGCQGTNGMTSQQSVIQSPKIATSSSCRKHDTSAKGFSDARSCLSELNNHTAKQLVERASAVNSYYIYPAAYFLSIFVWIWCSTFHCVHYLIHFSAKGAVATVGPPQFLPNHQTQTRSDFPNTVLLPWHTALQVTWHTT